VLGEPDAPSETFVPVFAVPLFDPLARSSLLPSCWRSEKHASPVVTEAADKSPNNHSTSCSAVAEVAASSRRAGSRMKAEAISTTWRSPESDRREEWGLIAVHAERSRHLPAPEELRRWINPSAGPCGSRSTKVLGHLQPGERVSSWEHVPNAEGRRAARGTRFGHVFPSIATEPASGFTVPSYDLESACSCCRRPFSRNNA